MIVLFTDFGVAGPYVGQVKAVLAQLAPGHPVIDLQHDAPSCDPKSAAYLLAALVDSLPPDGVFLCVVDPGVGGDRAPGVLKADDRWFIGPDNGLFEMVIRQSLEPGEEVRWWNISWRPEDLSASFHGRDIFAPVAARLVSGQGPDGGAGDGFSARELSSHRREDWPDDLHQVIYIDGFGNAMTGIRAGQLDRDNSITLKGTKIQFAETFSGPGKMDESKIFFHMFNHVSFKIVIFASPILYRIIEAQFFQDDDVPFFQFVRT